jgi:peptidyl-tRNA hydrolase
MATIIPDREAFEQVEREYPNEPDAEKYRLAQATVLLRLLKAESLDDVHHKVAEAGLLENLISDHNQRTKRLENFS